jgi:hypothetical protein
LAHDVRATLHDVELELLWFTDLGGRLGVFDLRDLSKPRAQSVLIATHLPEHAKLSVWRAGKYVEGPGRVGEEWMELVLHWEVPPWIDGGEGEGRIDKLDGREWLDRERSRREVAAPAWRRFAETDPHVALPSGIAQCEFAALCGAAQPFGSSGWQLVIAKNDESSGDFSHNGCLLYDPDRKVFARPANVLAWVDRADTELGTCGPYQFNAREDAYLVADKICRLGETCASLDGFGIGWFVPGAKVGME